MTRQNAKSLRVVIADSDPVQRRELRLALCNAGVEVIGEAEECTSALRLARILAPDVVIFDGGLRGTEGVADGIAAAEQVQSERIAPAVMVATHWDTGRVARAARAGLHAYLVHPVRESNLAIALEIARSQWEELRYQQQRLERLREKERTREAVDGAKRVLMEVCGVREVVAYQMLRERSMNTRRPLRAIAEAVLLSHQTAHATAISAGVAGGSFT